MFEWWFWFLFYHGNTNLTLNKDILSSQTLFQKSLSCPSYKNIVNIGSRWPDFFAIFSNHCEAILGLLSLDCRVTIGKWMWQNKYNNIMVIRAGRCWKCMVNICFDSINIQRLNKSYLLSNAIVNIVRHNLYTSFIYSVASRTLVRYR